MNAPDLALAARSAYPSRGGHCEPNDAEWLAAATVQCAEIACGYRSEPDHWKVSRLALEYANARACREGIERARSISARASVRFPNGGAS